MKKFYVIIAVFMLTISGLFTFNQFNSNSTTENNPGIRSKMLLVATENNPGIRSFSITATENNPGIRSMTKEIAITENNPGIRTFLTENNPGIRS